MLLKVYLEWIESTYRLYQPNHTKINHPFSSTQHNWGSLTSYTSQIIPESAIHSVLLNTTGVHLPTIPAKSYQNQSSIQFYLIQLGFTYILYQNQPSIQFYSIQLGFT